MDEPDLKLETRFSSSRGAFPYVAAAFAVAGILGIVLVMTTGVASRILPMNDRYLDSLVPTVADGSPPLALQTLATDEKSLTIDGTVMNRTESTIAGLLAVIQVNDRYTLPAQMIEVPVEPAELASKAVGKFHTTIVPGENGFGGYTLQFKLSSAGPFVPHKDERSSEPVLIQKTN